MKNRFVTFILLLGLVVGLSACADTVQRGEVIKPFQLEQLEAGKSTYNDVLAILGTPTSISTYDPRIWYYFSQTKSQWGFLDPSFTDQEVYQIKIDEQGRYVSYRKFTGTDAVKLSVSKDTTPTVARDKSFWQELVSNFGRYRKPTAGGGGNPASNPFSQ